MAKKSFLTIVVLLYELLLESIETCGRCQGHFFINTVLKILELGFYHSINIIFCQ